MFNFNQRNMFQNQVTETVQPTAGSATMAKSFLANVFTLMVGALGISGLLAYVFSHTPALLAYIVYFDPITGTGGYTTLGWIAMFAPLLFVFTMAFAYQRFSVIALTAFFMLYAAITGISLCTIFLVYDPAAITTTFFITAGTFAVMAILGYTTKTDLTKFGSLLMMALVGLIIAMVVNWFVQSSSMGYLISCIGVLIFTGLIAYDTQKLKNIGAQVGTGNDTAGKLAVMGALSLYLDFINLFLFLLRILGGRE